MKGYIHSIESFGTVDGPGIRFVVFLQGCPLRCKYCHNPDTWEPGTGNEMTVAEILAQFEKNRSFYSNGGITVTGGEPLMQIDFVTELFTLAKEKGIHTCIDTSGALYNAKNTEFTHKLDKLMDVCDLVMLDIKHIDSAEHKELTGMPNEGILDFARYLEAKKMPIWVRHVLVPGVTDSQKQLTALGCFIGSLTNVKALDVLPYHTLGVNKYEKLGIEYPLKDVPAATGDEAAKAKTTILNAFYKTIFNKKKTT